MTKKDAARRLGVSRPTLDAMLRRGDLADLDPATIAAFKRGRKRTLAGAQAAERIGVSRRTVTAMLRNGRLADLDPATVDAFAAERAAAKRDRLPVARAAAMLRMTVYEFKRRRIEPTRAAVQAILDERQAAATRRRIERETAARVAAEQAFLSRWYVVTIIHSGERYAVPAGSRWSGTFSIERCEPAACKVKRREVCCV